MHKVMQIQVVLTSNGENVISVNLTVPWLLVQVGSGLEVLCVVHSEMVYGSQQVQSVLNYKYRTLPVSKSRPSLAILL